MLGTRWLRVAAWHIRILPDKEALHRQHPCCATARIPCAVPERAADPPVQVLYKLSPPGAAEGTVVPHAHEVVDAHLPRVLEAPSAVGAAVRAPALAARLPGPAGGVLVGAGARDAGPGEGVPHATRVVVGAVGAPLPLAAGGVAVPAPELAAAWARAKVYRHKGHELRPPGAGVEDTPRRHHRHLEPQYPGDVVVPRTPLHHFMV
mmetsp:Transcript_55173/g.166997  ORF Transcript_55173/g.166997 Transcript_55173/m.166997 type:complete len:206 (-) Transcript_55173:1145-1762(-)